MSVFDLFDLSGKVSIVTGGGYGLGKVMATGLAMAGSDIVICSRKLEKCETTAHELEELGVKALPLQCDINSDEDVDRLCIYVIRQLKYGIEHNLFKEMKFASPKEFLGYRIVAKNIENIGDNAVSTAKNFLNLQKLIVNQTLTLNQPIDEEVYSSILKFHSFVNTLLKDSLKAMFKRAYYLADEIISRFMSTGLQLEKDAVNNLLSKRIDPNVASFLRLILNNSRTIMEYARDIAEVTLNRTVEEISKS